jgi:hypothetical protein
MSDRLSKVAEQTGIDLESTRDCSGRYLLNNHEDSIVMNPLFQHSLEIKDINASGSVDVLDRIFKGYEEFRPKNLHDDTLNGSFIHVKRASRIMLPLETCYYLTEKGNQIGENLVFVDDGAEANIITACAKTKGVGRTTHIGSTNILLGRGASLTHTMVHYWDQHSTASPSGVIRLGDDASYVNNYVSLNPVKNTVSDPIILLTGENSRAVTNNVLYVTDHSKMDVGGTAYLYGKGSRVEMNTRAVCLNESSLISRGLIEGNHTNCKGHLECRGLVMDESSMLEAIPILRARKPGPELTHEAGIGGLSQREINYLMMRRMTEDEAVGALIRGFMDLEMDGLPDDVHKQIAELSVLTAEAS